MDGGMNEKGSMSHAALSAHSKTSFYGYAHALLHLRMAIFDGSRRVLSVREGASAKRKAGDWHVG